MSVRKFSTKLNSLAKYTFSMANLERGKLNVFMRWLRPNIAKYLIMRYNLSKTYLEALERAPRSKTMK